MFERHYNIKYASVLNSQGKSMFSCFSALGLLHGNVLKSSVVNMTHYFVFRFIDLVQFINNSVSEAGHDRLCSEFSVAAELNSNYK